MPEPQYSWSKKGRSEPIIATRWNEARSTWGMSVKVEWFIGGVFYFISFDVGKGEPAADVILKFQELGVELIRQGITAT